MIQIVDNCIWETRCYWFFTCLLGKMMLARNASTMSKASHRVPDLMEREQIKKINTQHRLPPNSMERHQRNNRCTLCAELRPGRLEWWYTGRRWKDERISYTGSRWQQRQTRSNWPAPAAAIKKVRHARFRRTSGEISHAFGRNH